ncbi:hypothetical protein RUM43_006043 [Polyplax serrata]|uniref:Uncharacterized protein n=1 Tax=Polyplax serrata TaxID=468196 RepID=A0AAN8NXQ5_POLSC
MTYIAGEESCSLQDSVSGQLRNLYFDVSLILALMVCGPWPRELSHRELVTDTHSYVTLSFEYICNSGPEQNCSKRSLPGRRVGTMSQGENGGDKRRGNNGIRTDASSKEQRYEAKDSRNKGACE